MQSNYKLLGNYIREVNERDTNMSVTLLLGVSIQKKFIASIANIIGTDMSTYKIVRQNQFAYGPVTSRNGDKVSIALLDEYEEAIVSQAYTVFKIIDTDQLLPEYLMMWFRRPEFDRYARFMSHGSARETFDWDELCNTYLPIPDADKQREIIKEFHTVTNRITMNKQLITKLEETAQAIYNQWFVNVESLDDTQKVKLEKFIQLNPTVSLKKGQLTSYVEMNDLATNSMCIRNFVPRAYLGGSRFQNYDTLLARITPCLENGKTGFVDFLQEKEVAWGSTEFIVMRAKKGVSPYWLYCLAKDEKFRSYAISSMVGSSGRERVHEGYLKNYLIGDIDSSVMDKFHLIIKPVFDIVGLKNIEQRKLNNLQNLLLSKLATIEEPIHG